MGFTDMRTSGDSDLNPRLTPGESERKIESRGPGAIGGWSHLATRWRVGSLRSTNG